jgi:hypothetical protein
VSEVHTAILGVMDDLCKVGLSKDRTNQQQQFKYRGIDDLRNVLAPLLVKHKLLILPCVLSRQMTERESAKGGALFSVVLEVQYTFKSVIDDSTEIVGPIYGEAMDSGDKATNKALSVAYKYMCFDAFSIRTEGDDTANDPDATTHEVLARAPEPPASIQPTWDGHQKVGFSKLFRDTAWSLTPQDFLDWCNNGNNRLNAYQRECALREQSRRDAIAAAGLPADMPERFFAQP